MPAVDTIKFKSRAEALTEFARTIGTHPPRDPVPNWWNVFETWYLMKTMDPNPTLDEEGRICLMVRMEHFKYEEDKTETASGGKGGDVTFAVGRGSPDHPSGSFVFYLPADGQDSADKEVIRIDPDGSFFYKDRKVEEDRLVYAAFRHWVIQSQLNLGKGCTVHTHADTATDAKLEAVPASMICTSCEQGFRMGVTMIPDGRGGNRHVVGSPECSQQL